MRSIRPSVISARGFIMIFPEWGKIDKRGGLENGGKESVLHYYSNLLSQ